VKTRGIVIDLDQNRKIVNIGIENLKYEENNRKYFIDQFFNSK